MCHPACTVQQARVSASDTCTGAADAVPVRISISESRRCFAPLSMTLYKLIKTGNIMNTHKNKTAVRSFSILLFLSILLAACGGRPDWVANTNEANLTDAALIQTASAEANGEVRVVITGGHETNPIDHGRPVILIASMLGVTEEVFREAFSHVTPASGGQEPNPIQVRLNKSALMDVLGPYSVTNEYLDEVSNYYRYNGSAGETWPQVNATAEAIITDGVVTGIEITNPGSGYTSVPVITLLNSDQTATATLLFTNDFDTNGSINAITIEP
jgi:hypothetical protein